MAKTKRETRYMILSRDTYGHADYDIWDDEAELEYEDEEWGTIIGKGGRWIKNFTADQCHRLLGLTLRKGTQRRVKITFFAGGGCSWRWAVRK